VVEKWLQDLVAKQAEKAKNVDPVMKSADVLKKRDEVIYFATPIMTRPKPKPPVVPGGGASGGGTPQGGGMPGTQTPNKTDTPKPEEQEKRKREQAPEENGMDVD
jgi:heat shock protein 4